MKGLVVYDSVYGNTVQHPRSRTSSPPELFQDHCNERPAREGCSCQGKGKCQGASGDFSRVNACQTLRMQCHTGLFVSQSDKSAILGFITVALKTVIIDYNLI